jgi:transcriptional accessory protein Tex/SPT6
LSPPWKRLLQTSIQGEIRLELKQKADAEPSRCFGIRTGSKIAVVDETGKFLAHEVIRQLYDDKHDAEVPVRDSAQDGEYPQSSVVVSCMVVSRCRAVSVILWTRGKRR